MSKFTISQVKRGRCLGQSSVMGAGSLYVVLSTIIQMVTREFASHEFAGWLSFGIKFANSSDAMSA